MFMCCVHLSTFATFEEVLKFGKQRIFQKIYTHAIIYLHLSAYLCISLESLISQPSYILAIILINHLTYTFQAYYQSYPSAIININIDHHAYQPSCHLSIISISNHANQTSCLSAIMPIGHST